MAETSWEIDEIAPRIDEFLDPVLDCAAIDVDYEIFVPEEDFEFISPNIIVNFEGPDAEMLLAHRAELLLALEHLTLETLGVDHEERYKLIFDANDYRLLRMEELRLTAETAAERVRKTGREHHFSPMTSRERRILHLTLRDYEDLVTLSEGSAQDRHTVIYLKGKEPPESERERGYGRPPRGRR